MSTRRFSLLFTPITLPCLFIVCWLSISELSGANQDNEVEDKPYVIELRNKIELAEIQVAIREQMVNVAKAEAANDPAVIRTTEALLKEAHVDLEKSVANAKRLELLGKRGVITQAEQDAANATVKVLESRVGVIEAKLEAHKKPSRVDIERIRLLELKAKKAKIKLDQLKRSLKRFLSSVSDDIPLPLQ